ncbi:MAG TPA: sugar phosphate nucleotidyltransferase, partial [Spirochaetia bacterium]|nr:sugar phosphate nucleotidyltransferase [Spirochaetia bacterium]
MLGTGHALLQAKGLIGNEACIVAYPDDLHEGTVPLSRQLIDLYEKTGCSVLAALHDPPELNRYGILELDTDNLHVLGIVEKPKPGKEPSREASIGRYLYTPEFFTYLEEGWIDHLKRGTEREYFHTYALGRLMEKRQVVYKQIEGRRIDTGSPEGYLRAIISHALQDPKLEAALMDELSIHRTSKH